MAWCLCGTKPLSKPMLTSHQKHPKLMYRNWPIFIDESVFKVIVCNFTREQSNALLRILLPLVSNSFQFSLTFSNFRWHRCVRKYCYYYEAHVIYGSGWPNDHLPNTKIVFRNIYVLNYQIYQLPQNSMRHIFSKQSQVPCNFMEPLAEKKFHGIPWKFDRWVPIRMDK